MFADFSKRPVSFGTTFTDSCFINSNPFTTPRCAAVFYNYDDSLPKAITDDDIGE